MSDVLELLPSVLGAAPASVADAVDLDGVNDYGSRNSDLIGNVDGKTFTLSFFHYEAETTGSDASLYRFRQGGSLRGFVSIRGSGEIRVGLYNSSGTQILNFQTNSSEDFAIQTWNHYVISIDMTNSSATYCYKNDQSVTFAQSVFTNDNIDFTCDEHLIKSLNGSGGDGVKGRLSHLFLDYTYRDLSIEANRRLFVEYKDGFLQPTTTQASLSPIILMPFDDPTDPFRNDGTGGAFSQNGVIARSGRGPSQYNPKASGYNGVNQYLSRGALNGASDGALATFSIWIKPSQSGSGNPFTFETVAGLPKVQLQHTGTKLRIRLYDSGGSVIVEWNTASTDVYPNKWTHIFCSVDTSTGDTTKKILKIDGVDDGATPTVNSSNNIDLTTDNYLLGQYAAGSAYYSGDSSDFWFDTSYNTDETMFYDTETGKAKPLGINGELPTGSAPILYLPLDASDPGKDASGNGNDFTVNGGPLSGERGPNEIWASSAEFNGSNQYLNGSLSGLGDGKQFSFLCAIKPDNTSSGRIFNMKNGDGIDYDVFDVFLTSGDIRVDGFRKNGGGRILRVETTNNPISTDWLLFAVSADLNSVGNRSFVVSNLPATVSWAVYTNDEIGFSTAATGTRNLVGALDTGGGIAQHFDGRIGYLAFWDQYINWSDESTRLLATDAFNFPTDLSAAIEAGTIPRPVFYLNKGFENGTDLSGNNNNFTPVNGPANGGDVRG